LATYASYWQRVRRTANVQPITLRRKGLTAV
jgi:hypothetical protein